MEPTDVRHRSQRGSSAYPPPRPGRGTASGSIREGQRAAGSSSRSTASSSDSGAGRESAGATQRQGAARGHVNAGVTARSVPRPQRVRQRRASGPARRAVRLGDGRRRLRFVVLAFGFVLSLVAGRLFEVQGVEGPAYAQAALRDRETTHTLTAQRGEIVDRHGVALATDTLAYDVSADPTEVVDPARVAAALARILPVPAADLQARIAGAQQKNKTRSKPIRWVSLAQRQPTPVRQEIQDLPAQDRSGVIVSKTTKRIYPSDSVASNIIGYLQPDGQPGAGLELELNNVLAGKDGKEIYEQAPGSNAVMPTGTETITEPVDGSDVQLTIDRDLQWKAQEAITAQVKASKADWGSVIVEDAKTGEIYALANSPGYDPNNYTKYGKVTGAFTDQAVASNFEPGSTSKVMTVASAIEQHLVTPTTVFTVPDQLKRAGRTFHDDEPHGVWHPTVTGILAKSSNVGTIQIAERMSVASQYAFLKKFGIGDPPATGLQGEENGILAPYQDWSSSQRYTIAFGQGVATTLLQVAEVYQTLANGGVRLAPTVVKSITGPDGKSHPGTPARNPVRVVSPSTAAQLMQMMEAVTYEGGTGKNAVIPGYRVAGKTGTAWIPKNGGYCRSCYQSSFAGVVPADNPRLVVVVTISSPRQGSHFGGTIGAPVFKQVASFALSTFGIAPSGTTSPKPNFGNVGK